MNKEQLYLECIEQWIKSIGSISLHFDDEFFYLNDIDVSVLYDLIRTKYTMVNISEIAEKYIIFDATTHELQHNGLVFEKNSKDSIFKYPFTWGNPLCIAGELWQLDSIEPLNQNEYVGWYANKHYYSDISYFDTKPEGATHVFAVDIYTYNLLKNK